MATINITMDDGTKTAFEGFCESVGLTVSAAMNMFAKITIRENRIPFNISDDPFWTAENQNCLRKSVKDIESGRFTAHEIIEAE